MKLNELVKEQVHGYFWDQDLNCALTTLHILSEHFEIPLQRQVLDSAVGMHGAGGYRAQCGIVEGTLMFIGILGKAHAIPDKEIVSFCKAFAQKFESEFSSLECKILRPEGFHPDNPPHMCEPLTVAGIVHSIMKISNWEHLQPPNQASYNH